MVVQDRIFLDRCPNFFLGLWDSMLMVTTDYPHWQMIPELKVYYLLQAAYWSQQLVVLAFKLEKPRPDYNQLFAHHLVTPWLIGSVTTPSCA